MDYSPLAISESLSSLRSGPGSPQIFAPSNPRRYTSPELQHTSAEIFPESDSDLFPLIPGVSAETFDNLFQSEFPNIRSVFRAIFTHLSIQDSAIKKLTETNEQMQNSIYVQNQENFTLKEEIEKVKDVLKVTASEDDVFSLRFEVSQKFQSFDEQFDHVKTELSTLKDDLNVLQSDFLERNIETDDIKRSFNESKQEQNDKITDISSIVQDMFDEQKTRELVEKKSFGVKEQEKPKSVSLSSLVATVTEKQLENSLTQLEDRLSMLINTASNEIKDQKPYAARLERLEENVENFRDIVDGFQLGEQRRKIIALARDITRLHVEIKELRQEHERKIETVAGQADIALKQTPITPKSSRDRTSLSTSESSTPRDRFSNDITAQLLDLRTDISDVMAVVAKLTQEYNDVQGVITEKAEQQEVLLKELQQRPDNKDFQELSKELQKYSDQKEKERINKQNDNPALPPLEKPVGGEVMQILDQHSQQLSNLLHTKADLQALQLLEEQVSTQDSKKILEEEEIQELKSLISTKVGHEDVNKVRRNLQRGLMNSIADQIKQVNYSTGGALFSSLSTSVARVHYRCLACDDYFVSMKDPSNNHSMPAFRPRTSAPSLPGTSQPPLLGFFDLAPNVAYRRSYVKDLVRAQKTSFTSSSSREQNSLKHRVSSPSFDRNSSLPEISSPRGTNTQKMRSE